MPDIGKRLLKLARTPRSIPAAAGRRVFPNSPRFGTHWMPLPGGAVSFDEYGFVEAPSPSMLLARHNFELARIAAELADVHARRSLEIGCGFGRLSTAFARHSDSHTAIDINDHALASARVAYPDIDFRAGGALSLAFPADHFDLVVTWTVLQHIRPTQIDTAIGEILRVLAPGATLLICEEIRDPKGSGGHTWHRPVRMYEELLAPLRLQRHSPIDAIARLPDLESPGEVMVFRGQPAST